MAVFIDISLAEALIILSGFLLGLFGHLAKFPPIIFAGGVMVVLVGFSFFLSNIPIMLGFFLMGLMMVLSGTTKLKSCMPSLTNIIIVLFTNFVPFGK